MRAAFKLLFLNLTCCSYTSTTVLKFKLLFFRMLPYCSCLCPVTGHSVQGRLLLDLRMSPVVSLWAAFGLHPQPGRCPPGEPAVNVCCAGVPCTGNSAGTCFCRQLGSEPGQVRLSGRAPVTRPADQVSLWHLQLLWRLESLPHNPK